MSRFYEDAMDQRHRAELDAHVAAQLNIEPEILADYPYRIEENIGTDGATYSWHVFWDDEPPPGVTASGSPGAQWNDIAIGHFPENNEDEAPVKPDVFEVDLNAKLFEIPNDQSDFWEALPLDYPMPRNLPKATWVALIRCLRSTLIADAEMTKLMFAIASGDNRKIDKEMATISARMTQRASEINLLLGSLLIAIKREPVDER